MMFSPLILSNNVGLPSSPQPVHRSRDDDEQRSAFHKWHRQPQRAKTDDDDEMTSTYGSLSIAARPPARVIGVGSDPPSLDPPLG